MKCVICNEKVPGDKKIMVNEMMLGTKEEFEYYQCCNCKAIQIQRVPNNMSKYYQNYYTERKKYVQISPVRKIAWRIRRNLLLTKLYSVIALLSYNSILHWAYLSKINKDSNILDVGCGKGDVLFEFSKHGFINLYGIDPYLKDTKLLNVDLQKNNLLCYEPKQNFDLIMFNHSFEHIYEQHQTLSRALSLLKEDGVIMIRMPVINKAFDIYKRYWVQLDAPRHLVIHSLKSINFLCEKNGAVISDYFFDSTAFQFLGSEQFRAGISSYAQNSYKVNLSGSIFSKADIKSFSHKAKEYNKKKLGDQAAFFIKKKL